MSSRSPRQFLSVKWIHTLEDEPVLMVSELDSSLNELRKIEYFKDGSVGIASRRRSSNGTMLSIEPLPPIDTINADPQFVAEEISEAEFEAQWDVYV